MWQLILNATTLMSPQGSTLIRTVLSNYEGGVGSISDTKILTLPSANAGQAWVDEPLGPLPQ